MQNNTSCKFPDLSPIGEVEIRIGEKSEVKLEDVKCGHALIHLVAGPAPSERSKDKEDGTRAAASLNVFPKTLENRPEIQKRIQAKEYSAGLAKFFSFIGENGQIVALLGAGSPECAASLDSAKGEELGWALGDFLCAEQPESLTLCIEAGVTVTPAVISALLQHVLFRVVPFTLKTKAPRSLKDLKRIEIVGALNNMTPEEGKQAAQLAKDLARSSRWLHIASEMPHNMLRCVEFAEAVKQEAKSVPALTVEVKDEAQCRALQMGSFLSVQRGSSDGARLVHISYKHGDAKRKIAFVGKGIMMDTGGYSIKSADGMLTMKGDMAGAASILAGAFLCGRQQPKDVEVHFIAMCCSNMVSSDATVPNDIVTASNGKTIEVTNTDAEGRLVLADGLVFAEKCLGGPGKGLIIDCATLTGNAIMALGSDFAAVLSNNKRGYEIMEKASAASGELTWPLPLFAKYRKEMDSNIADIKNAGPRRAGAILAGLFLNEFVSSKTTWVHVDAAGPLDCNGGHKTTAPFGLRLWMEIINHSEIDCSNSEA